MQKGHKPKARPNEKACTRTEDSSTSLCSLGFHLDLGKHNPQNQTSSDLALSSVKLLRHSKEKASMIRISTYTEPPKVENSPFMQFPSRGVLDWWILEVFRGWFPIDPLEPEVRFPKAFIQTHEFGQVELTFTGRFLQGPLAEQAVLEIHHEANPIMGVL